MLTGAPGSLHEAQLPVIAGCCRQLRAPVIEWLEVCYLPPACVTGRGKGQCSVALGWQMGSVWVCLEPDPLSWLRPAEGWRAGGLFPLTRLRVRFTPAAVFPRALLSAPEQTISSEQHLQPSWPRQCPVPTASACEEQQEPSGRGEAAVCAGVMRGGGWC